MNDGDRLFVVFLCAAAVCLALILIDGWFLRPKRDPGALGEDEPALPKLAGYALVGLALGMLWRLLKYEAVDFSLMLVVVGARLRRRLARRTGCSSPEHGAANARGGRGHARRTRSRAHRRRIRALLLPGHHHRCW